MDYYEDGPLNGIADSYNSKSPRITVLLPYLLDTGGSQVIIGPVSRYIAVHHDDGNDSLLLDNEGSSNVACLGMASGHHHLDPHTTDGRL
jgi:hypothetical protein